MTKVLLGFVGVSLAIGGYFFIKNDNEATILGETSASPTTKGVAPSSSKTPARSVSGATLPPEKVLDINYPINETFNNCPAAGLAMYLSYYGIKRTQTELAKALRPYNWDKNGLNDDKSTPPEELADYAKGVGLIPYYRANGSLELVKQFIANDTPVMMRTLLHADEDYYHYRVVKGYDDVNKEIIEDDGYNGRNIHIKYSDFMVLWKPYNYEYLVLATPESQAIVERIMGAEVDPNVAWQNAVARAENDVARSSKDTIARFNLAVSLYYTGDYARSVAEYEKIESSLSRYALWFRIEPIQSYFELGNYARIFSLAERIIADKNPAYSELYLLRGKIYLKQDQKDLARQEFEKAVFYNTSSKIMREALASLGN